MVNNIYATYGMFIADSKKELRAFILGYISDELPIWVYDDLIKNCINKLEIVKFGNGKYAVKTYKITSMISKIRELIDD